MSRSLQQTNPNQVDYARRAYSPRIVARHRQHYFEMIRRTTVNYATVPVRRSLRQPAQMQDIDNPLMTFALQSAIVLAIATTAIVFRAPLLAAMLSAVGA